MPAADQLKGGNGSALFEDVVIFQLVEGVLELVGGKAEGVGEVEGLVDQVLGEDGGVVREVPFEIKKAANKLSCRLHFDFCLNFYLIQV